MAALLATLKDEKYLCNLDFDRFINRAEFYFDDLNYIYLFREGNGRAIREFMRLLIEKNGYKKTGLPVPALVGIGAAALLLLIGIAMILIKRKKAAGTTNTNAEATDESEAAPSGADETSDNLDDEAEQKISEMEEAEVK